MISSIWRDSLHANLNIIPHVILQCDYYLDKLDTNSALWENKRNQAKVHRPK